MRLIIEFLAQKIRGNEYKLDSKIPVSYLMLISINRIFMLVRGKIFSVGMNKKGKNLFMGKKIVFICKNKIVLGNNVTIKDHVYMDAMSINGIKIGNNSSIGVGTIIRCSGNLKNIGKGFSMGNNSSLADNCFIGATGGVDIGNDVIGGQNIRFHSSNHIFDNVDMLIRNQGITAKGIIVGDNCWIGAGVVFCDGVHVGNGCVIGADSVVTTSFPDNCLIAGNPARIIRMRTENHFFNED